MLFIPAFIDLCRPNLWLLKLWISRHFWGYPISLFLGIVHVDETKNFLNSGPHGRCWPEQTTRCSESSLLYCAARRFLSSGVRVFLWKKLLRSCGLGNAYLAEYQENKNPLRREPNLRPKEDICAREESQVQRICEGSRLDKQKTDDHLLGRAVLTFAFTPGDRVGSLLPPRYGHRRETHVPLTRSKMRWVGRQCHV